MTFTNSVPVGITIFTFDFNETSIVSSFLSNWALPTKYLSAASLTNLIASASPSAFSILDCLIPSASLIFPRFTPSATVSAAVG
jgi:hypothetical protein